LHLNRKNYDVAITWEKYIITFTDGAYTKGV